MIANVSWNITNASSGIRWPGAPTKEVTASPSPTFERSPIRPSPTSRPKTSEYPYRTQSTVTRPMATKLIMIMLSTLLARTMPP